MASAQDLCSGYLIWMGKGGEKEKRKEVNEGHCKTHAIANDRVRRRNYSFEFKVKFNIGGGVESDLAQVPGDYHLCFTLKTATVNTVIVCLAFQSRSSAGIWIVRPLFKAPEIPEAVMNTLVGLPRRAERRVCQGASECHKSLAVTSRLGSEPCFCPYRTEAPCDVDDLLMPQHPLLHSAPTALIVSTAHLTSGENSSMAFCHSGM